MSLGKIASVAQVVVTLISFLMCVSVFFISSPPSISDEYNCIIAHKCSQEIEENFFYCFAILFAAATFPVLLSILSYVRNLSEHSKEIKENHAMLMAIASRSVLVIDKDRFEEFYSKALDEIRSSNTSANIIATSSFTPPDKYMQDKYFSELANIIISHNARYRVLLAKGNPREWDDYAVDELEARESHLNIAAKNASGTRKSWEYGHQFEARRSRYHARIDFLVVSDSVFMNMALSERFDGDRGYIYIKDMRVAELFRDWFDVIWKLKNMSDEIFYEPNPAPGKRKFRLSR